MSYFLIALGTAFVVGLLRSWGPTGGAQRALAAQRPVRTSGRSARPMRVKPAGRGLASEARARSAA